MRAISTCLMYAVIAPILMAETAYEFALSARAREYQFPRPLFEQAISAKSKIILEISKTAGKAEHFFYINYVLQCGQETLQSYAFSPFPINAGGRFILPQLAVGRTKLTEKYANTCSAIITLHSRDKGKVPKDIKVRGYLLTDQDAE